MYASYNTHEEKDQSFRDDLWSVLFSFVDILLGQLPWSEEGKRKEKVLVKDLKKEFTSNPSDQRFSKWIVDQILTAEKEVFLIILLLIILLLRENQLLKLFALRPKICRGIISITSLIT